MGELEFKEYIKKLTVWMYVSFGVWIFIICIQFIIGTTTLLFGYGFTTLLLMIYNIVGSVKYFKNIQIISKFSTKEDARQLVKYFEKTITPCWIFMFLNLIFGGFIGFVGNLIDLIIAYNVRGNKGMLLMPSNDDVTIIEE